MAVGSYGIVRPADVSPADVEILYHYVSGRTTDAPVTLTRLNSTEVLTPVYHNTNTDVVKYNYISSLDEDSLIHPEHINIHKISSLVQLQSIIENCISNI